MAKVLMLNEYKEYGDLSGISLEDVSLPEPGPGEVRISVDAFSLNYGDFELFADKYTFSLDLPARIGDECAGVVDAIGPGVSTFKVGDRVSSLPWMYGKYGVNGEFAICPAKYVAHYPDNLSPEEACCIWVAYLTCYFALIEIADVSEDDYALITAASSSAGMAAMELCRMKGAKTIGTSRTSAKRQFLLDIGFDHVIAQDEDNLAKEVMQFSGGKGARAIYDPIGGKIVQDYATALAQDAIIFLYGGMDQNPTILPEIEMTQKAACLRPFSLFNHMNEKDSIQRGVQYIYEALERGDIKSYVEKTYPLEAYKQAMQDQFTSTTRRGKLVITTAVNKR